MPVSYGSLGRRPIEDEKPLLNELSKLIHVVRAQHKEDRQVRKRAKEFSAQELTEVENLNKSKEENKESQSNSNSYSSNTDSSNSGNKSKKKDKRKQEAGEEAAIVANVAKKTQKSNKLKKRHTKRKSSSGGSVWITLKGGFASSSVPLDASIHNFYYSSSSSTALQQHQNTQNNVNNNNEEECDGSSDANLQFIAKQKKQSLKRIAQRVFLTLQNREKSLLAAEAYIDSAWSEAEKANLLLPINNSNATTTTINTNVGTTTNQQRMYERVPANNEGEEYLREQYGIASDMLISANHPVGQYLCDLVNKHNNNNNITQSNKNCIMLSADFDQVHKMAACKWHHTHKTNNINNNNINNKRGKQGNRNVNNNNKNESKQHVNLQSVLSEMDIREEMIRLFLYNDEGRRRAENAVETKINEHMSVIGNDSNNREEYYTTQLKSFFVSIAEPIEIKNRINVVPAVELSPLFPNLKSYSNTNTKMEMQQDTKRNNNNNNNIDNVDDDNEEEEDEFREAKEYSDEELSSIESEELSKGQQQHQHQIITQAKPENSLDNTTSNKVIDIVPTKCIVKIRNSQRQKHTSILSTQKAVNFFVTNFMQTLKRELGSASCKLPRGPVETIDNSNVTIATTTTITTSSSSNIINNTINNNSNTLNVNFSSNANVTNANVNSQTNANTSKRNKRR